MNARALCASRSSAERLLESLVRIATQALCVQTAHAVLSAVAEVSYATSRPLPQLGEACHALSVQRYSIDSGNSVLNLESGRDWCRGSDDRESSNAMRSAVSA